MDKMYDLIVIGLGPAGMKAAKLAVKNGLSVLAFEQCSTGGCCLNKGCVPTKAILHSSELFSEIQNCKKYGVTIDGTLNLDFQAVYNSKDSIIQKLSKATENELVKCGIEIAKERAQIDFDNACVNGRKAQNIIVATGSIPFELPNLPFNKADILSSDDILSLDKLPQSIAIIGSGAIGVEWARIFSNFNVQTSLIEKASSILPLMDIDIQKRMTRILKAKKVKIYTEKSAKSYTDNKLILDDASEIEADIVLVAVGRKKAIPEGLIINEDLTTNYPNIYAIGDIASSKMLAHTATMQADYIINKILNKKYALTPNSDIPSVIYGSPEAASIGVNEQDIDDSYKIYNLPISYLPKSWCDATIDGFIKIITKDGLIKGAHIVSKEASSLISQIQILMKTNYKVDNIKDIVFAHPTYSEGILEAILNG